MGLFGGKSTEKRKNEQLRSVLAMHERLVERMSDGRLSPYLRLERPDSLFQFSLFCLSVVTMAVMRTLDDPDYVLNAGAFALTLYALDNEGQYFGGKVDPDTTQIKGAEFVQEYVDRLSSAFEAIASAGNVEAGAVIVRTTVKGIESPEPISSSDHERLEVIAEYIFEYMEYMRENFK